MSLKEIKISVDEYERFLKPVLGSYEKLSDEHLKTAKVIINSILESLIKIYQEYISIIENLKIKKDDEDKIVIDIKTNILRSIGYNDVIIDDIVNITNTLKSIKEFINKIQSIKFSSEDGKIILFIAESSNEQ